MPGLRTLIFDVADLAAAKRFYAQVVGSPPYFDEPFYVGFEVGGYELGLRPAEGDHQPGVGGATSFFAADDVDATIARVVALGARVREAPQDVGGGIRTGSVIDPFGNVLGFIHNPLFAPPLTTARADDLSPTTTSSSCPAPGPRCGSSGPPSRGCASW